MTDLNDRQRDAMHAAFYEYTGDTGSLPDYDGFQWSYFSAGFTAGRATPAPQAAPSKLETEIRKLTRWKHCMSYNDSYFGEPAGLVKIVAYQLERILDRPAAPLTQAADQSAAGELLTDDEIEEAATDYYKPCTGLVQDVIGFARSIEYRTRAATPAAPLAQQSVPIGYVANTAHGWQFRTAAPDENSQWAGMWRAVAYISAQQSEPVAWAVVSSKGGVHKLAVTRESAERKAATWQKEWPNNGCTVRSLVFGDAAPLPAQQASERDALLSELLEEYESTTNSAYCQSPAAESLAARVRAALAAMGDARKGGA